MSTDIDVGRHGTFDPDDYPELMRRTQRYLTHRSQQKRRYDWYARSGRTVYRGRSHATFDDMLRLLAPLVRRGFKVCLASSRKTSVFTVESTTVQLHNMPGVRELCPRKFLHAYRISDTV